VRPSGRGAARRTRRSRRTRRPTRPGCRRRERPAAAAPPATPGPTVTAPCTPRRTLVLGHCDTCAQRDACHVSLPTCNLFGVQTARIPPFEWCVECAAHLFCVRAAARARHSLPWGTDPWEARARTADDASPAVMKNAMNWSGPSTCACAAPEHLVYICLNTSGPHHLVHIP